MVGLHRTPARKAPLEPLAEAVIRQDWGVEGDRHARPASSRQIVLTQSEVLDALGIAPGATREQLTCSGLGVVGAGDVVVTGSVRLELVRPRVPCPVMDGIRPGLMDELRGRAGWCARVLAGGIVRPGDEAAVERRGVGDPPWLADYLAALATWEAAPPRAPGSDGWGTFAERLAHLVAWDERGVQRIDALAGGAPSQQWGPTDVDAFNAAAVERLRGGDLWTLHDHWSTAVVDAARRWPAHAEPWVRSLAAHYREHT